MLGHLCRHFIHNQLCYFACVLFLVIRLYTWCVSDNKLTLSKWLNEHKPHSFGNANGNSKHWTIKRSSLAATIEYWWTINDFSVHLPSFKSESWKIPWIVISRRQQPVETRRWKKVTFFYHLKPVPRLIIKYISSFGHLFLLLEF